MAASYDFVLTVGPKEACDRLRAILRTNGFTTEQSPEGGLIASRGNPTRTLLLGAFAGKAIYLRFDVEFIGGGAPVIARLRREPGAGAVRGGLIGATRTASIFDELARRVGAALAEAGLLSQPLHP
jgi:hypothetical protein